MPEGPHPAHGSGAEPVDRGTLWHCPEVERIMAGPLPGIFEVPPEVLAEIDETFRWEGVYLGDLFEEMNSLAKGRTVSCVYVRTGRPGIWETLSLASDLQAEIDHDPKIEGGWRGRPGIDCGGRSFTCHSSLQECGFYVLQTEFRTGEGRAEDEEACSFGYPPEVPVERGGRAPGGGD